MSDEFLSQNEIDALLAAGPPAPDADLEPAAAPTPPRQDAPPPPPAQPPRAAVPPPPEPAPAPVAAAPAPRRAAPQPSPAARAPAARRMVVSHAPSPRREERAPGGIGVRLARLEQVVAELPPSAASRRLRARVRALGGQAHVLQRQVDALERHIALLRQGQRPPARRSLWSTGTYLEQVAGRRAS